MVLNTLHWVWKNINGISALRIERLT